MNTNTVSFEAVCAEAQSVSTTIDAYVFVLWTPQGFVVDQGPQNEQEAQDFIIDEADIEMTFYGGERV